LILGGGIAAAAAKSDGGVPVGFTVIHWLSASMAGVVRVTHTVLNCRVISKPTISERFMEAGSARLPCRVV
jgi:hypothetical protein